MREIEGNLWDISADAKCITTNGSVRTDGKAVMGRGVALQARECWPGIDAKLGSMLNERGNIPHLLISRALDDSGVFDLVTFPVKRYWNEPASYDLVRRSCIAISAMAAIRGWNSILLPRPGCGNGRLKWERVEPILRKYLKGDKWIIVYEEGWD